MRRVTVKLLYAFPALAFASTGMDEIFHNLYKSLNEVYPVLISLCWLLGLGFILKALFMLKKMGYKTAFMNTGASLVVPSVLILVGVVLMYTPRFLKVLIVTLYGGNLAGPSSGVQNTADWQDAGSGMWYDVITPMVGLIQVIGLISFIRGWILVVKGAGSQQPGSGNVTKGIVHVVGGVLAINITGTIDLITKTLGIT